jgi:UDP-glucose 4-epimerase
MEYQTNREEIITDTAKVTNINAILLRYFNQLGHIHQLKWELPLGVPQNLVPFITQTGFGLRKRISCLWRRLPNSDGTAIHYIHVVDLAKAHVIHCNAYWIKKYN